MNKLGNRSVVIISSVQNVDTAVQNVDNAFSDRQLTMPSDDVDGMGPGAHGTESVARHRKNTAKQSNADHIDAPAYTDEQHEAVKRYQIKLKVPRSI